MFGLFFDQNNRVLLARFTGILRREDVRALVAAANSFGASHATLRAIVDFSEVDTIDIQTEVGKRMAAKPQATNIQTSIYVMPNPLHFGLGRMFAAYQDQAGHNTPTIVRTMPEAYAALGVIDPHFEVVPGATPDT